MNECNISYCIRSGVNTKFSRKHFDHAGDSLDHIVYVAIYSATELISIYLYSDNDLVALISLHSSFLQSLLKQ